MRNINLLNNSLLKTAFVVPLFLANCFTGFSQFAETHVLTDISASVAKPRTFFSGDFDGDGDDDVLTGSFWNDALGWYENLGGGHFGPVTIIADGVEEWTFVMGFDIDDDGDLDAVAGSREDNTVYWYENTDGEFGTAVILSDDSYDVNHFDFGDIDDDGDDDLVVSAAGLEEIIWIENLGGGTFSADYSTVGSGIDGLVSVDIDDIDEDGTLDVLCKIRNPSGSEKKVSYYPNDGDGTFSPQIVIDEMTDNGFGHAILSDLDNDGDQDIISATSESLKMAWYENEGSGDFGEANFISDWGGFTRYRRMVTADIDEDGDQDIIGSTITPATIVYHENLGGGDFTTGTIIAEVTEAMEVQCVDMDEDGDLDVAFNNPIDEIGWIENTGGATFGDLRYVAVGVLLADDVLSLDVDEDGDQDIISASPSNNRILYHENLGDGVFVTGLELGKSPALDYHKIEVGDFNGDGRADIFSATDYDMVMGMLPALPGGGFDEFEAVFNPGVVYDTKSPVPTDLNGDGTVDLVCVYDERVAWFQNFGSSWSSVINLGPNHFDGSYPYDLDNDGDMDIVCVSDLHNQIRWYENLAGATFGSYQTITGMLNPIGVIVADMNGDGIGDILANQWDEVYYYVGLGDATYDTPVIIGDHSGIKRVLAEDVDLDGDLDIIVGSSGDSKVAWYENIDGTTFSAEQIITESADGVQSIRAADLDNDGDLDVMSASNNDNKIAWYENYILSGEQAKGEVFIDFNENGEKDAEDVGISLMEIVSDPEGGFAYTYPSGKYFMNFDPSIEETYEIYPELSDYWGITSDSLVYHININDSYENRDSLDFGLFPDTLFDAVETNLVGGFPRCNALINYWIDVQNIGTTLPSGVIHLTLDDSVSFVEASIEPDSIVGQNIYWYYDSLFFFDEHRFSATVLMPDFLSMGDTLKSYLTTRVDSLDGPVFTAADTLCQTLVCAYDPNDKIVEPAGVDSLGYLPIDTEMLEYTVRFQNTGTDTAINVQILDQLDPNLNWSTFQVLSSSHELAVDIEPTGQISFNFNNIMLPDSNVNVLGSQGFVKFKIFLNEGLPPGTVVRNDAAIYFDSNPAIITNTTTSTLFDCDGMMATAVFPEVECPNRFIQLGVEDDESNSVYTWEVVGDTIVTESQFEWFSASSGTYTLLGNIENALCSADTLIEFVVMEAEEDVLLPTLEICESDSVLIFDTYQHLSGVYYDSLLNHLGCDSVIAQELIVLENYEITLPTLSICENDSASVFGVYRTESGVYYDSLTAVTGCDSVLIRELEVMLVEEYVFTPIEICENDSSLIFGTYEMEAGIYRDTMSTLLGCDSILVQELIVHANYLDTLEAISFCTADSVMVFGVYRSEPGFYTDSLLSGAGCDSVQVQELIEYPVFELSLETISICENDSILLFGNYESMPGVYYDSLVSVNGCDSVIVQELITFPVFEEVFDPITICANDSSLIFGAYETEAGIYKDTLSSVLGCDSILVQELIHFPVFNEIFDPIELCASDSVVIFGEYQNMTGLYYDSLLTVNGCDSVLIQELIVLDLPEVLFVIPEDTELCLEQAPIALEGTPGGVFSGSGVVEGVFNPAEAGEGEHTLYCSVQDENDCVNVDSIVVSVVDCLGLPGETESTIHLYPNPFDDFTVIYFGDNNNTAHDVVIYNTMSQVVYRQENTTTNQLKISREGLETGVYFVEIFTHNERVYTAKIIVY